MLMKDNSPLCLQKKLVKTSEKNYCQKTEAERGYEK